MVKPYQSKHYQQIAGGKRNTGSVILYILRQQHTVDLYIPILRYFKAAVCLGDLTHGQPGATSFKIHQDGRSRKAVHDRDRTKGIGQGESDIVGIVHTQVAPAEDELRPAGKADPGVGVGRFG